MRPKSPEGSETTEEIIKFQQETKLEMILSQIDVSKFANSLRKSSG
ncbi:MAG: hypothetical protein PWQ37_2611, partial [Candidatus Petromonas sp.]|nr:hypothetical protein [Candidatus Petromonas sp.]